MYIERQQYYSIYIDKTNCTVSSFCLLVSFHTVRDAARGGRGGAGGSRPLLLLLEVVQVGLGVGGRVVPKMKQQGCQIHISIRVAR